MSAACLHCGYVNGFNHCWPTDVSCRKGRLLTNFICSSHSFAKHMLTRVWADVQFSEQIMCFSSLSCTLSQCCQMLLGIGMMLVLYMSIICSQSRGLTRVCADVQSCERMKCSSSLPSPQPKSITLPALHCCSTSATKACLCTRTPPSVTLHEDILFRKSLEERFQTHAGNDWHGCNHSLWD